MGVVFWFCSIFFRKRGFVFNKSTFEVCFCGAYVNFCGVVWCCDTLAWQHLFLTGQLVFVLQLHELLIPSLLLVIFLLWLLLRVVIFAYLFCLIYYFWGKSMFTRLNNFFSTFVLFALKNSNRYIKTKSIKHNF